MSRSPFFCKADTKRVCYKRNQCIKGEGGYFSFSVSSVFRVDAINSENLQQK